MVGVESRSTGQTKSARRAKRQSEARKEAKAAKRGAHRLAWINRTKREEDNRKIGKRRDV